MNRRFAVFIIVAYRPNMRELGALLTSLNGLPVIVVDNGRTLHRKQVGRATLLIQRKNLGYGAAANRGIHHASARGFTWFVVLNQDMRMSRAAVLSFIRSLKKLSPCIAGPFGGGLDSKRWTTVLPSDRTDYLTGSCLAIHSKVVSKIGYFYEPYFLYYEDADYGIRARNAGFSLVTLGHDDAKHRETRSLGAGSILHQYYLARNHFLFIRRLAPFRVTLYEMARFPKTVAEHMSRKEIGALTGIRDYFLGRFGQNRSIRV